MQEGLHNNRFAHPRHLSYNNENACQEESKYDRRHHLTRI